MRVVKQQTAIAASSKYEFSDMLRLRSGVEWSRSWKRDVFWTVYIDAQKRKW